MEESSWSSWKRDRVWGGGGGGWRVVMTVFEEEDILGEGAGEARVIDQ